jgi:hypothetical protein
MNEEQRHAAVLKRLQEMGVQADEPIYTLTWQDAARVIVETDGFETAANLPTDVLVHTLNTIRDGLEYLEWYENIQHSLRLAQQGTPSSMQANAEDGHLESELEDRISGAGE